MKNIEKMRDRINDEAIEFLRKGLYADRQDDCPEYVYFISITERLKTEDPGRYEENLKIFKTLFNAGNENYKTALWNCLTFFNEGVKFCKKDFSRDELAFIKAAIKAASNPIYEANVNEPIETDRLILRGMTKRDSKLLAYHYKYDGDAEDYFGRKPTNDLIKRNAARRSPTFFTIEEKNTHSVIGYVGLNIRRETATGLLEYYIFKEYRKCGYCKEAVKTLVNVAMEGKLYEPKETVRDCVYDRKAVKLNAIRARISTANTASLNTVKSCGFIYEATIHKTMPMKGIGWTDEEVYYIPMEEL